LIKGQRLGQPENTVADYSEKVAQHILDLSSSVDVLVPHQDFIIEVVSGAKVQRCGGRPAQTPKDCSFARNARSKLSSIVQEERAAGDEIRQVANMFECGDGSNAIVFRFSRHV
jgi:hypothetical protein